MFVIIEFVNDDCSSEVLRLTRRLLRRWLSARHRRHLWVRWVRPGTAGLQRYPATTQIAAAAKFISEHRSQISLITVSISGNDVTACAKAADAISCVGAALSSIKTTVTQLASQLRTSAGAGVPIYGLTYPDVLLGAYVYPTHPATASQINIAQLSVPAFKSLINPALQSIYEGVSGTFIDVTANTGAYTPLTETVNDPTYGTIPKATAEVCTLTWYCAKGDIHSKNVGYDASGKMIVDSYNAAK